jgi:hypothetical protein
MSMLPSADRPHWWARFAHLAFWRPALRVLCYHQVHPGGPNRFAVTPEQLDQQLGYLVGAGFHFIHARDLLSSNSLPERPLLLTFDDGYVDNLAYAQPVLQRHGAKATIFIVTAYAGDRAQWNTNGAPLMGPGQLRELDPRLIELALHSHTHRAFCDLVDAVCAIGPRPGRTCWRLDNLLSYSRHQRIFDRMKARNGTCWKPGEPSRSKVMELNQRCVVQYVSPICCLLAYNRSLSSHSLTPLSAQSDNSKRWRSLS